MTKFVSFGEIWLDVDAEGNPGTIVHSGEDLPASMDQASIDWMAKNGYIFDPMPDVAKSQTQQTAGGSTGAGGATPPPEEAQTNPA